MFPRQPQYDYLPHRAPSDLSSSDGSGSTSKAPTYTNSVHPSSSRTGTSTPFGLVDAKDYVTALPQRALINKPIQEAPAAQALVKASDPHKGQHFYNVSLKTLGKIADPRPVIFPMTARRAIHWAVYGAVGYGIYMAQQHTDFVGKSKEGVKNSAFAQWVILGVLAGLEPAIMAFIFATAKMPKANPDLTEHDEAVAGTHPSQTDDVALLITCHNSAECIEGTLKDSMPHFTPKNTFILDNGNSPEPTDNTEEVVKNLSKEFNYVYIKNLGCKTTAQWVGTQLADKFKYVLVMDDDVKLPRNFRAPIDMINDEVKGVTFPIIGVHPTGMKSTFVDCQTAEYHIADTAKLSQNKSSGALTVHGAAGFFVREILDKVVLRKHSRIYFGDDIEMGRLLQRNGYKMKIDTRFALKTDAPPHIFGEGLTYWNQRPCSWEMSAYIKWTDKFLSLLMARGQSADGIAVMKMDQIMELVADVVNVIGFPTLGILAPNKEFWMKYGLMQFGTVAPLLGYKYITARHRPDMQISLKTIAAYPFYKQAYKMAALMGFIKSAAMYYPGYVSKQKIPEIAASGLLDGVLPQRRPVEVDLQEPAAVAVPLSDYYRQEELQLTAEELAYQGFAGVPTQTPASTVAPSSDVSSSKPFFGPALPTPANVALPPRTLRRKDQVADFGAIRPTVTGR